MSTEAGTVRLVPAPWRGFAWRRAGLAFGVTLLAVFLFGAAFAAGYASLHAGRVLPGVDVADVPLDGMTRREAAAELRRELPSLGRGELVITIGAESQAIRYSTIGRDYDMERMLDDAFAVGRGGTPIDQVGSQMRTLMSGVNVPATVTWDAGALADEVAHIVAGAQVAPLDAALDRPDGRYAVTPSVTGQSVDLASAVAAAMAAVNNTTPGSVAITLEPTILAPSVSTAQAQAAADQANLVIARPLQIAAGSDQVTIEPETLAGWAYLEETGPGSWQVRIDEGPIGQWVAVLKSELDVPATDAGYTFEDGEAVVTPAADGYAIDGESAELAIMDALQARIDGGNGSGSGPTPISLAVVTVEPEFSTAQAQALVTEVRLLGAWTTDYEPSIGNGFGVNIKRPTQLINNYVVQPGDVFDFVEVAGPITEANGYTSGAAIIHGNTQFDGVLGGGLCSCSTTLFNAALRAGFEMGARRNHAYFIDRYPVGLDATIWINGSYVQTMSFTNDTDYPILIRGINRPGSVTFRIYGVPDGRVVEILPAKVTEEKESWTRYEYTDELPEGKRERLEFAFDGFKSVVRRIVTDAQGNVIHDDTFRSSYRRVIGHILIGRGPDDPPAGTIEEPGKPPDA